jgi:hypothetical protein
MSLTSRSKDGQEVVNTHQIRTSSRGELRVWDNEVVMGWYVATEGAALKGHDVLLAAPARPADGRPLGRAQLRRPDHHRLGVRSPEPRMRSRPS